MRRKTLSVIRVVLILNVIDMDTVIAEANSYSSDSSSKSLNRDRKKSNHYHDATPGSNSNKLEGVLVS